jgi:uncharacterized membrane protein YfcA
MTTVRVAGRESPGFGAGSAEHRLRVATGGAVSTALVVAGLCLAGIEWQLLLLVAGAGVVGSAAAWLLEPRRPSSCPELRYALVGAVLAVAAVLALSRGDGGLLLVVLLVALPVGAVGGALGGLVAARLPERLLRAACCLAVVLLAAAGAVAVQRTLPWLSGSYLVVEGPSSAGSAQEVAADVVTGLRSQPDPSSDAAWEDVASSVVTLRSGGRLDIGYDRAPGGRRIDVLVDGERACVEVRSGQVRAYPGGCRGD